MARWKWLAAFGMAIAIVWGALAPFAPASGEDKSDRVLTKKVFIHFRRGRGKPDKPGKPGGGGKPTDDGYYAFLASGCRWKAIEPFVLSAANGEGLSDTFLYDAVLAGMSEWESRGGTRDIFGPLVPGTATYNEDAMDGINAISFGDLPENIIAVTVVWGYFGGPPKFREILEADLLFNDGYVWGDAAANPDLMDVQNIATHELGHVAGMDDLYLPDAGLETMYGYSEEGDLIKRDLYNGDITGIRKLYGQ
ncbi:MAG TPA: matrixin family metalloprotease [Planctomycetota bacterium]|nr:matrixin family metalloprotease [Planctomycetota bacterium]